MALACGAAFASGRVGGSAGPRTGTVGAARETSRPSPYSGLGTWVDVYDWSRSYTNGHPTVGPADVDRMAAAGVQTLFIQASKWDSPTDVVDPDLLTPIIQRAHARGIRVVVWYLPTLTDVAGDLRRLVAIANVGAEGEAVDIESRDVQDPADRSRRLVDLSNQLRAALPGRTLGAIVFPPTGMEVVNPNYWPGFPWAGIAPDYDVWLPMAYWTGRTPQSGWRDGYRYTADNVMRLRNDLHNQAAPVHPIGGVADDLRRDAALAVLRGRRRGTRLGQVQDAGSGGLGPPRREDRGQRAGEEGDQPDRPPA